MKQGPQPEGERARARVLAFIEQFKRDHHGSDPSLREIAVGVGLPARNFSQVYYAITGLELQGRITVDRANPRRLRFAIPGFAWAPTS
jgi:hypothetical protein